MIQIVSNRDFKMIDLIIFDYVLQRKPGAVLITHHDIILLNF